MNAAVCVLTYNAIDFNRVELLETTLRTVEAAFPESDRYVLDNGSTDGTDELLTDLLNGFPQWHRLHNGGSARDAGAGHIVMFDQIPLEKYDVFIMSDDDQGWHPDAWSKISSFFAEAPDDVVLVGGYLEPEWPWNTIRGVIEAGGVRGLWRDNACGCSLMFRTKHRDRFPTEPSLGMGWDSRMCQAVIANGYRTVSFDVADNLGWGSSTWGNQAIQDGKPLDRAKWGV